jgi:hypothetical protein
MSEIQISQAEADQFLTAPKVRVNDDQLNFPLLCTSLIIPLVSQDKRDSFLLDISASRIKLSKLKLQTRVQRVVILARLDLGGAPHRNPDGEELPCPHLHIYREGFGDKWAYVPDASQFSNLHDQWKTLNDFMRYCAIVEPLRFIRGVIE